MTKHSEQAYLQHILESIAIIPQHFSMLPAGKLWHENVTVRDAVLRTLQTMSESCQNLSDEAKATMPHIAWRKISGFRNVLVHDYLGDEIDYDVITSVIETLLPELEKSIKDYYTRHYG